MVEMAVYSVITELFKMRKVQAYQHSVFYRPDALPANSVKSLNAKLHVKLNL